jgi:peptidoglycan pentaglycine glycine transferase (the first glycine)
MKYMTTLRLCQDQEVWDDYVLEEEGHPLQLWGWGQVKATHGWTTDRLFAYDDNDEVVAAAQVLTRRLPAPLKAFSYIPRGPVGEKGSSLEFLELVADFVKREHKSVAVSIEPDSETFVIPEGWKRAANSILPRQTIVLDLTLSDSDLLAAMVKKTRQYIRKSASENMVIRQVRGREEIDKCLAIYHQTSKRAKFDLHKDQYYYDVFNMLSDHSPIFAAFVDNEPVAFLWLAISADTAFELYGGVNEKGQELRLNYALKWHAIRKTREWGLSRYDFGGLLGDGAGVTTFKKSWTDHETELVGTFDKPLSPFYSLWNSGLPTAKKVVRRLKSIKR